MTDRMLGWPAIRMDMRRGRNKSIWLSIHIRIAIGIGLFRAVRCSWAQISYLRLLMNVFAYLGRHSGMWLNYLALYENQHPVACTAPQLEKKA